jgi:hypothetical protein
MGKHDEVRTGTTGAAASTTGAALIAMRDVGGTLIDQTHTDDLLSYIGSCHLSLADPARGGSRESLALNSARRYEIGNLLELPGR